MKPAINTDMLSQTLAQLLPALPPVRVLSEQEKEALYALAYRHYQIGQYLDALKMFWLLIGQDMAQAKYYKATASCLLMLKHYKEAIIAFGLAFALNDDDVVSLFYMAQACLAEGRKKQAQEVLQIFLERTENDVKHSVLHQRARAMAANIPALKSSS